ncbi:MAG: 50S ribosomal protein L4 [Candidatus Bathyarchaeia archaeon]
MKVPVLSLDNKPVEEIELPKIFETPIRPDIIKKAVIVQQSHNFQPQGRDPMAGKRTTAESWGVNRGLSRVPRLRDSRRAAFGVSTVKGHQAFPPTSKKRIAMKIGVKERRLAICSGIAATIIRDLVEGRGHILESISQLPIVVEDNIQSLKKTKDVKDFLKNFGLWLDVERCIKRKTRAGRGKTRGRRNRVGKGPLIIVCDDEGISKACANIPGVDVVKLHDLNAELLAPGAIPGRLVVWSKSALLGLNDFWGGLI